MATKPNQYLTVQRILVVEDDLRRQAKIESWIPDDANTRLRTVRSGNIASTIIELDNPSTWSGIMLDHDLDIINATTTYKSGADVAITMIGNTRKDIPVLIHSMNPEGSARMKGLLEGAGFDHVTRIPFSDLTKEAFLEWTAVCSERAMERRDEREREMAEEAWERVQRVRAKHRTMT